MSLELASPLVHEASCGAERRFRFLDEACDDLGARQDLAYEAHRLSRVQRGRLDIPGRSGPWVREFVAHDGLAALIPRHCLAFPRPRSVGGLPAFIHCLHVLFAIVR